MLKSQKHSQLFIKIPPVKSCQNIYQISTKGEKVGLLSLTVKEEDEGKITQKIVIGLTTYNKNFCMQKT